MEEQIVRVASVKVVPNPQGFTDDVYDVCDDCGAKVMLRPGGPMRPEAKIMCLDCAMPMMVQSAKDNELEINLVDGTREEVETLLRAAVTKEMKRKEEE